MSNQNERASNAVTRRDVIKLAASSAAAIGLGACASTPRSESGRPASPSSSFRFAHLTDIHVEPELRADEGLRQCITTVHNLKPRPDFILTGGDLVFDVLAVEERRAKTLFDLFTGICKDSDIPIHHCVGNHDIFGWGPGRKVSTDHASYGRKMVQERLGLERTTYSFDHKGCHFCVVDDIQAVQPEGYEGGVSEQDLDWLARDLKAAAGKFTIVCAHIPFVSVVVYRDQDATKAPNLTASKGMLVRNPGPVLRVLREQEVKLVLTGHLHQNERIQYEKTVHIGDGAVCGAWWKGPQLGNPEGFGVIDVRADGTFEHHYQTYGWKAGA